MALCRFVWVKFKRAVLSILDFSQLKIPFIYNVTIIDFIDFCVSI